MPPKVKVTKKEIIDTALALCRGNGPSAVNARAIAAVLGCSTQPIFSNFATMEALEQATLEAAYACYLGFLEREAARGEYPTYKAYGMAYIHFAREERELFRLLFMCDREGKEPIATPDFDASVDMIMKASGLSRERAHLLHLEMWSTVHGIATMSATSFLDLDEALVGRMLTDVYQGVRARHISEETENGSH
jgi:AcrR family transcriptional regulator